MNDDRSWFWNQGHADGFAGARKIVRCKGRNMLQRSDYYDGYEAGKEERIIGGVLYGGLEISDEMLDEEERREKEADPK